MSDTLRFEPRRTNPHPQTIADKLQVLLLKWPAAGAAVERFIDKLLAEFHDRE